MAVLTSSLLFLISKSITVERGQAMFRSSVCEIVDDAILVFTITTSSGVNISTQTRPITTTGDFLLVFLRMIDTSDNQESPSVRDGGHSGADCLSLRQSS
jgi:hypothetical protein